MFLRTLGARLRDMKSDYSLLFDASIEE